MKVKLAYKLSLSLTTQTFLIFRLVCAKLHAPTSINQKCPTTTIRDDTTYSILRPGVMISSDRFLQNFSVDPRSELYTTAGVPVKDKNGNVFVNGNEFVKQIIIPGLRIS
jgi:hypothetical protein